MTHGGNLRICGGSVVTPEGVEKRDLCIENGRFVDAPQTPEGDSETIDAAGKWVFPGLIDPQVHFREPGLTHKEDLETGSLAAIAGGVTSFMEMPNTNPNTTSPEALADKLQRAAGRCRSDHAFFLGASPENADQLGEWEGSPGCSGIKIFMGSSTGSLLVRDDATIERVLRSGSRRVAVHSEDDYRLKERYAALGDDASVLEHHNVRDIECAVLATTRLLNLVEKTRRKVHILHLSTAEEVAILRERDMSELVTVEVTPNHLFLEAPDCYERYGALAQMNPPVREVRHREALREALMDGTISCIGSDHAPHTAEEKAQVYPKSPSGIPGVQTILPLLLTAVRDGWMKLEDIPRITASAPSDVYDLKSKGRIQSGCDGDLVIVDPNEKGPLPLEWLRSRAGQSPYVGMELAGWPVTTILRGQVAYHQHEAKPAFGQPLVF